MNIENMLEGINLIQSLYREELNKKKQSIFILFSKEIAIEETNRIDTKISAIEKLLSNLKLHIEGDQSIIFSNKDKVDFKMVLGYCLNYLNSLEKIYPIFSRSVGDDEKFDEYDTQLKKQQTLIFNIQKEMKKYKIS